jgi:MFS family permease
VSAKWLFVSLTIFLPSYLFMTPTFACGDQTAVKEVDACPIIETCAIDQIYTITNYAGLYCEQLYVRNSIVSAEFVGSLVGLILLSILADKIGRKIIIVSTLFLSLMGTTGIFGTTQFSQLEHTIRSSHCYMWASCLWVSEGIL